MAIEAQAFREVMAHWATGVTIVTTLLADQPVGITASSFSSLSLQPPQILICVNKRLHTLQAIVDSGFFAVDNLPATLIPALIDTHERIPKSSHQVAVSINARTVDTISAVPHIVHSLRQRGLDCRILFLDASDDAITRRFAETRRPHPLADRIANGVGACIAEERRLLGEIAELGQRIDPTTDESAGPKRRGKAKKRHTVGRVLTITVVVLAMMVVLALARAQFAPTS